MVGSHFRMKLFLLPHMQFAVEDTADNGLSICLGTFLFYSHFYHYDYYRDSDYCNYRLGGSWAIITAFPLSRLFSDIYFNTLLLVWQFRNETFRAKEASAGS